MNRVLLVTATLGKWGETNGVVNTYLNLIPQFKRKNIALDVLTYGPEDAVEEDGRITIRTRRPRVPVKVDEDLIIDSDFSLLGLSKELSENDYSVVHSATPDLLGYLALQVARNCDCPLVSAFHTSLSDYAEIRTKEIFDGYAEKLSGGILDNQLNPFYDLSPVSDLAGTITTITGNIFGSLAGKITGGVMTKWLQLYFNSSALILAPSDYTRKEIMKTFRPRVEVFSRGVDTVKFSPGHRTRRPDARRPRALYVGRVAPEKNLKLLVDTFSDRPDVQLTVVGDGPYLEEMKRELPGAEYTGKLSGEYLYTAYANGDFFVFPSRTDTFGNVVLEAMSSGLPVIVTDSMAPKEQVRDGETGFIAGTDEELADAVDILAKDSQLRDEMRCAARAYAEERTWDTVFDTLLDQYELARRLHGS